MTIIAEQRFCELLEQPDLNDIEWHELEDLARTLDLTDELDNCFAEALREFVVPAVEVQRMH